jgi:thiol-disulfide isomerase/thioredoxin
MPENDEKEGVVGLANRQLTNPSDIPELAAKYPLGCFFAFVTDEDAHSPLMLPVYDELVTEFEDQIPLFVVQVALDATDQHSMPRNRFLVYSVPTLVWYNVKVDPGKTYSSDSKPPEFVYLRTIGTVLLGKLIKEVNDKIDEILGE